MATNTQVKQIAESRGIRRSIKGRTKQFYFDKPHNIQKGRKWQSRSSKDPTVTTQSSKTKGFG